MYDIIRCYFKLTIFTVKELAVFSDSKNLVVYNFYKLSLGILIKLHKHFII